MSVPSERPQPPAVAYQVMVDVLGDAYFKQPAAVSHVSTLRIIGTDHRPTEWVVPTSIVPAIDLALRARFPGVRGQVIARV